MSPNIIRICLFEGLRPNEIYSMKWEEIEGSRYQTLSKMGLIETELTSQTLKELKKLNRNTDYVFEGRKPNTHIKSIRKTWHKACELADITDLELYDLRKTFSSKATQTFGVFDSSKLTNHKSTKVVEKHYSHLDSGETKERKLHFMYKPFVNTILNLYENQNCMYLYNNWKEYNFTKEDIVIFIGCIDIPNFKKLKQKEEKMIEVVVALIMYLDGSMIEHTYKDKMSACLKSKRIAGYW